MQNRLPVWLLVLFLAVVACNRGGGEFNPKNAADSAKIILEELDKKISEDAENPVLYQARSRFFLNDRQFDNALKDINRAISLDPKNPDAYVALSEIYLLTGQIQNAKEVLAKAINLDPRSNSALLSMAKLNLVIRDYPRTFEYIQKAISVSDVNPEAYFTRALAFLETGDTNKAIMDILKAVDQNQGYFEAYMQLGELYSIRKNPIAADYLKNALAIRPNSKEALYLLGMFYQETSQYFKAIETYKRLQKTDSTFRNAPYNIGYIYLVYLKDFPRAVSFFSEAIKADPAYFEAYFNRGYAQELNGFYDKASADYQQALKIKVNYPNAVEGLNRLDQLKVRK
jgi:tetratricopeptide (TPR) repeat protein